LRPYLEKTLHKRRAAGMAQGEFKPQYCQNRKEKLTHNEKS
jgi:hypothetical protein